MSLNLDRLIRLLGATGSDADAEVLMAARAADRMLRAEGLTWEQLMRGRLTSRPKFLRARGRGVPASRATGAGRGVHEEWGRR